MTDFGDAAFTTVWAVIESSNGETVALYDSRGLADEHCRRVLERQHWNKLAVEEMPLFDKIPDDWAHRS